MATMRTLKVTVKPKNDEVEEVEVPIDATAIQVIAAVREKVQGILPKYLTIAWKSADGQTVTRAHATPVSENITDKACVKEHSSTKVHVFSLILVFC